MDKFSCIELTQYFNADRSPTPLVRGGQAPWVAYIQEPIRNLPGGQQTFRGIPFRLGPAEGEKCWLVLGTGRNYAEISLPPDSTASYVLFAHFCNISDFPVIGALRPDHVPVLHPGEHLADYTLIYADGSPHGQPIRRLFEISQPMYGVPHRSFVALPHVEALPADFNGPHERGWWGSNQRGYKASGPADWVYWIYALPNPRPEQALMAVRLEATGADTIAVAGITLYHGLEHPLRHRRLESMRITVPSEETALPDEQPVDVDLGTVTRKYAPPQFEPDSWLRDEARGCGEEALPPAPTSQFLIDVTASPDATVSVGPRDVDLRLVYDQGAAKSHDGLARVELMTPRKTWVHVTVTDESTGAATPVRVHFRAPDGRYLPPYGHRHEVNDNWFEDYGGDLKLGSTQYAYVDGRFQIELPVGECYVEVTKGFEYEPMRARLDIQPGQRELTLRIPRRLNLRREGWVTADTHVHFLSPQTAWLEARAEGVNLVNLLASQWGDLFTNVADITGDVSGVSQQDTIVWVGTENRQHILGHISLLGVKGEPVFPMCAAGPGESYMGDPTWSSLAGWADLCREREGVVVIPHFPYPYTENVADIILGKVDAVEIRSFFFPTNHCVNEWYRFLNLGYRVAAVGGTDKMSAGMPVGGVRTYANLGEEEFTFTNWGKAVRAGRTFTTSGPLVGLQVEGATLGDEIRLPHGGGGLEVHAWARSVYPFDVLQVVVNGEVVAEERQEGGVLEAQLKAKVRVDRSSWLAARCLGSLKVWHCWPALITAHTSPVYVQVGDGRQFRPSDATYMMTFLEGGLAWLETLAIPADQKRHAAIKGVFESAHQELHRRLHLHGHAH